MHSIGKMNAFNLEFVCIQIQLYMHSKNQPCTKVRLAAFPIMFFGVGVWATCNGNVGQHLSEREKCTPQFIYHCRLAFYSYSERLMSYNKQIITLGNMA